MTKLKTIPKRNFDVWAIYFDFVVILELMLIEVFQMIYPIKGNCQCGYIQYEVKKPFILQVACHCYDCQKFSATAFGISAVLERDGFELISGELKVFVRTADSGNKNEAHFCPNCGNRIYHVNLNKQDQIRLKPGTLEDTSTIQPTAHYWVKNKQDWVDIPKGVQVYDTQPKM